MERGASVDRLARVLFGLTVAVAVALGGLVLAAPLLDDEENPTDLQGQVVRIFARDRTLRRTAIASVIGLVVTACIFFRPAPVEKKPGRKPPRQTPKPPNVVGA